MNEGYMFRVSGKWFAGAIAIALAFLVGQAQTPTDGVVDYFDANSKSPTDIFSIGPDGQEKGPPGLAFYAEGRPADCLDGLKWALRAGIPYRLLQEAIGNPSPQSP